MKTMLGNKPKPVKNHIAKSGPVDNLEQHLKPDWWKRIFNAMYLKTDADIVEDREITEREVSMFTDILQLNPNEKILDMACGQGRHLLELARRGQQEVFGIDRSRFLIQRARARARNEGLNINFKEGDVRKLPYPTDTFDCVTILGNSFGYFESTDDDLKILKEIFRVLKPNGRFLMDVADGNYLLKNYVPRSWEWIDKKHFVCRERSLAADKQRLISREVITDIEKGVIVDQFYAERLYRKEDLEVLLKAAGFTKPVFHGEIESETKRNQDLGMMERRMIITTSVIKEWTPKKVKKDVKNIVVLMGDPTLRDVIKPDGVFDDDDLQTISKLKMALGELEEFKFTYLNNHNTLIQDLLKLQGKVDFALNLCDEGFHNDALKELHVPAVLEMLKIPYSGSNPQCLAYCYDKSLIRGVAAEMGVPVADAFLIKPEDSLFEVNLPFPVIAKPNFGDSSFGITQRNVVYNIEQLDDAIVRIRSQFGYDKPILVEQFLTGAEISVGVVGNALSNMLVFPLIEEDYSQLPEGLPHICGYEAKWLTDSPYFHALRSIKADLPNEVSQAMISDSLKMFERLGCRDYCRFDWRLDHQGNPKLLEVNPNPGWCWDGHLAKMASFDGINYPQMLDAILKAAEHRIMG
jgi:D-alanine-D-alanine ligase